MTDLRANAARARSLGFNLTGPLPHDTVVQLAELWLPEIRFHELERFHPVDLERLFKVPVDVLRGLPPADRRPFLIVVSGADYVPPVVRKGSTVLLHGGRIDEDLTASPDGTEALLDGVDSGAVYTHGRSLTSSRRFFGASDTVSGNAVPQPGDPRAPVHDIVVRAELRYLLDALRHDLQQGRPDDPLWGRFGVAGLILSGPHNTTLERLDMLRQLVAAYEAGDQAGLAAAFQRFENRLDLTFNRRAWDAVRYYAFLEFYFMYAYNDYHSYGTPPFVNEHEGDVEGCCVVFDRRHLDQVAAGNPIGEVVGHTVITSVHEEFNDNDELRRLPVERNRARDDLVVWVAPGSHATYLSAGAHDVVDWEDILTDWPLETSGWLFVLAVLLYPALFPLLLMAGLAEHFADAEDQTTDNGVRVGSSDPVGATTLAHELVVTPLSHIDSGVNLYQAAFDPPENGLEPGELARRAYPGKWGAHDGLVDHSAPWENKTERYFRAFLGRGEITGDVIL